MTRYCGFPDASFSYLHVVLFLTWTDTNRLVYHMHIHCGQDSLMTSAPSPLMPAELSLPFPQSRQLWFAGSAEGWKEAYFSLKISDAVHEASLVDCLADLSRLRHLPILFDVNIAMLSVLHGIATTVRSHRHQLLVSVSGIVDRGLVATRESVLPDEAQHRSLLRVFDSLHQTFRLSESGADTPCAVILVLELLLLHFYCSVEQMELLAGKEGFEEAQASYPALQQWADTREARQAVWQAGQILKVVKALPLETMNDFHSVALYHASLCLWAYGTLTSKRCDGNSAFIPLDGVNFSRTHEILLDGEESLESQRWIAFDRGRPVISHHPHGDEVEVPPRISLQSTDEVMQAFISTIRSKYPMRNILPPSTKCFCYLMHALGMSARKDTNSPVLY